MFTHISNNRTKTIQDEEAVTTPARASVSQTGHGFLHLKQHLKEMTSVRKALTTGRPLVLCLRAQQDKVPAHQPQSSMSTKSPSSKTALVKDCEPTCEMSLQQHALSPAEQEIQSKRIRSQRQERVLEKMDWIYKILCALTNMKNKDLKTLVPLSSRYVNLIMKDVEKTNVLLKHSQRCLISSPLDDDQKVSSDMWETFASAQEQETKWPGVNPTGYKPQIDYRRRAKLKELENDAGELPPWLYLLWDKNVSYAKNPQNPKHVDHMLQRVRTEFLNVQRSFNNQMEMDITERKANQEERMRTLLNALMASRKDTSLPVLLSYLRSEARGPQSSSLLWHQVLQREAAEVADDTATEYSSMMQKIRQFHSFSHKTLPYCKERFCLLVLSLPTNQLLRPAMQDALLFLAKNVLQLPPCKLKGWFQYLQLHFYEDSVEHVS